MSNTSHHVAGIVIGIGLSVLTIAAFHYGPMAFGHPRIVVGDLDLGDIPSGVQIERVVTVKNAGRATLSISDLRTCCGCTAPYGWEKQMPPGSQQSVVLRFAAPDPGSQISKRISFITNDPSQPAAQVNVKGRTEDPLVDVEPRAVDLGFTVPRSHPQAAKVLRKGGQAEPMTIVSSAAWLKPVLVWGTDPASASVDLEIDPSCPGGKVNEYLFLKTGLPGMRTLTIPVEGFIERGVRVRPMQVYFGAIRGSEPVEASVMVLPLESSWSSLTVKDPGLDGLRAELLHESGGTLRLAVRIDPKTMPQAVTGKIVLENAQGQTVTVPVFAVRAAD